MRFQAYKLTSCCSEESVLLNIRFNLILRSENSLLFLFIYSGETKEEQQQWTEPQNITTFLFSFKYQKNWQIKKKNDTGCETAEKKNAGAFQN